MEGIILVVQMQKIIFWPVTLPRGAVLSYLLPICVFRCFFDVPFFLENHSIASHYFLQMLSALLRILPFYSIFSSVLWYFGSHFGVCSSVFGICSPSYLMEFLQMLLYYSDSHCTKRNFIAYIPLLGALCKIFGPIFGYLEKYETFS